MEIKSYTAVLIASTVPAALIADGLIRDHVHRLDRVQLSAHGRIAEAGTLIRTFDMLAEAESGGCEL